MATQANPVRSKDYSIAREDIHEVSDKVRAVDEKINALDTDWNRIPERVDGMEKNLTARSNQIDDLVNRNSLHSAKIDLLRKELQHVNLENDMLREYVEKEGGFGHSPRGMGPAQGARDPHSPPLPQGGRDQGDSTGREDYNSKEKGEYGSTDRKEPDVPQYLRNSSSHGGRQADDMAPAKRGRMHFGMERFYNYDSSLISANETKYKLFLGSTEPQPVLQRREQKQPHYGCFYIMRFHSKGMKNVDIGFKGTLTILRNCQGLILGLSDKDRIYVMHNPEGRNWITSREQAREGYQKTENALALLWFTDQNMAENFFNNKKNNRFREPDYPSSHRSEVYLVPANCTPSDSKHIAYLIIELKEVHKYDASDLTQFEGELCSEIMKMFPNGMPMIASSSRREAMLPGDLFTHGSKVYFNMFDNQKDIDRVYQSGMIHGLKEKWRLNRAMQIFSFTLLP